MFTYLKQQLEINVRWSFQSNIFILFFFFFIVAVRFIDKSIESIIQVAIFNWFPDLFNHIDKLLSDDVIDSERQSCHNLISFFQVSLFAVELGLKNLSFILVCTNLLHQDVLPVNQFESFFKRLIVIGLCSLVVHVLDNVSERTNFSFVCSLLA